MTLLLRDAQPGDVGFAHSAGVVGKGIRIAEFFRRDWNEASGSSSEQRGDGWNHVFVLDELAPGADPRHPEAWTVIQAEARGVTRGAKLSTVAPGGSYELTAAPAGVERARVLAFARGEVGSRYGFLSILCILTNLLTPRWLTWRRPGTWICSAVAAEAVRFGGWLHRWPDVYVVSPAELYCALMPEASADQG